MLARARMRSLRPGGLCGEWEQTRKRLLWCAGLNVVVHVGAPLAGKMAEQDDNI